MSPVSVASSGDPSGRGRGLLVRSPTLSNVLERVPKAGEEVPISI